MICQVCAFPINTHKKCPNCGFDSTLDYEHLRTLFSVKGSEPLSAKKKCLRVDIRDSYCCPHCGGNTFIIIPKVRRKLCSTCGKQEDWQFYEFNEGPISDDAPIEKHDLTWGIDMEAGTLVIEGAGIMPDYLPGKAPWFKHWYEVKTVIIQPGIKNIGTYAFDHFRSLEGISVPTSLTRIGIGAFLNCNRLKQIYYEGTLAQLEKIEIGDKNHAFQSAAVQSRTMSRD